jgi:putative Holliday junction resolvase
MAVLLGIDYGTKRVGLAWADDLKIALPIGAVVGAGYMEQCLFALSAEIESRAVDELVVGYPLHMDGTRGQRAEEVDNFIAKLKERFSLPVHRVDERLTSLAAREAIGGKANRKGADTSGRIDATAASLILKDFLEK